MFHCIATVDDNVEISRQAFLASVAATTQYFAACLSGLIRFLGIVR
jgi:hypothetical protein